MRNLDITTLRSFVAVADQGGVTRAAGFLHLTQSAVSMQLKRLEELLGLELLDRSGRTIALTASGEQLLAYARRMIALNDEVIAKLTDQAYEGEVVLGVPHDIVYPAIPRVLQRFNVDFPRVRVQLVSSYSLQLKEMYKRGECDLILTTEANSNEAAETVAQLPLRWIGAPGGSAWRKRPIPIAMGRRCMFRPQVIAALDEAGIPWELAVETENDRTIEATVAADLAIHAVLDGTEAAHLVQIDDGGALPKLPAHVINLYGGDSGRGPLLEALATLVRQNFRMLGSSPLKAVVG
ncbi:LysR family transcriptional regulator [Ruegeria profundi]|uniref:LysR family transcriptional regulator n=1 Tax=Ruegeria profundi TaxID=1685378 RepID=A0A0X3TUQ0_9RHOB|nr:LysR family transcriptional regulator [Ruegeria profundi]KUJ79448.1 LysR family transcriptional regulator [Ruegeria profundi]